MPRRAMSDKPRMVLALNKTDALEPDGLAEARARALAAAACGRPVLRLSGATGAGGARRCCAR
ncbi:MAG: hypothetical protein KatS3mg118_2999 [Paracoccaceae bacterium]|nr:MAG: hypothetical protein KatS3mg118_2999 [Paracoccaceae bacterium]